MSMNCSLQLPWSQIYNMQQNYYQQSYEVSMPWNNVSIQPGQSITFSNPAGVPQVVRLQGPNVVTANDTVAVNLNTVSYNSNALTFMIVVTLDYGTPFDMTTGLLVNLLVTLPVLFADTNPSIVLTGCVATTNFSTPPPFTISCVATPHQLQGTYPDVNAGMTYPANTSLTWGMSGPTKREKLAQGFKFVQNLTTTPTSTPAPTGGSGYISITIGPQPSPRP